MVQDNRRGMQYLFAGAFVLIVSSGWAESEPVWDGYRVALEKMLADEKNFANIDPQQTSQPTSPNTTIINISTSQTFLGSIRYVHAIPRQYDAQVGEWIESRAYQLPAPFLLERGRRQFEQDKAAALRWYARFRLMDMYDQRRCNDPTARQGIYMLMPLYREVFEYSSKNKHEYLAQMSAALEWAKQQQFVGSPMWLCSHGMSAFSSDGKPVSVEKMLTPKSQWNGFWNETLQRAEHSLKRAQSVQPTPSE